MVGAVILLQSVLYIVSRSRFFPPYIMYCLSRSITVDDLQFGPGFHLMIRNSVHRVRRTTVIGDDSGTAATPLVVVSIIHPVRTDGHAATTWRRTRSSIPIFRRRRRRGRDGGAASARVAHCVRPGLGSPDGVHDADAPGARLRTSSLRAQHHRVSRCARCRRAPGGVPRAPGLPVPRPDRLGHRRQPGCRS